MQPSGIIALAVSLLLVFQGTVLFDDNFDIIRLGSDRQPKSIKQGPLQSYSSVPGDPFWFQIGAMGDSQSFNHIGANVTIRTVFDQVNKDAHSYWVGGFIANGAFIQVGYLNTISTTEQPYCCAWFFEYFPVGRDCCPPVVGPEGSAGPIGSWHTYSMISEGDGVWSFYMDSRRLGSTENLGAADSGNFAPAAIAEVAQASNDKDILGPAEFKDLSFRTAMGWQPVPLGKSFIGYGKGTSPNPPPSPYGVVEVEGVDNNFLAGSGVPQPANNAQLWPVAPLPYTVSFSFLGRDQSPFVPTWISLNSSGTRIFYTRYQNQKIAAAATGSWTLERVIWHTVNVAPSGFQFSVPGPTDITVLGNVFSMKLRVISLIYSLPVSGATALAFLPDSLNATARTNAAGEATLAQLPPGSYNVRIMVPYGIASLVNQDLQGPVNLTARVMSLAEMLTIVVLPIAGAVIVTFIAWRKERARAAVSPTIPPTVVVTGSCLSCGHPLHPSDQSCPNCGAQTKQASG